MASLQIGAGIGPIEVGVQAGVQLQLSDLEVSVLGGAVKESQEFLAKNDNEETQLRQLATVTGCMKNAQGRPIKLEKSHEWFGRYVCQPPSTMGGHGGGSFVHRAKSAVPEIPHAGPPSIVGSKAVVIYGTYDRALPQLGYLLAWYKSQDSCEHKVYVEAGELRDLTKQDWCEIERKLDASNSRSRSVDKATGATAVAEITNQSASKTKVTMASLQLGAGIGIQLSGIEISVIGEAAIGALDFLAKKDNEDAKLKMLATVAGDVRNVQGQPVKLDKSRVVRTLRLPTSSDYWWS